MPMSRRIWKRFSHSARLTKIADRMNTAGRMCIPEPRLPTPSLWMIGRAAQACQAELIQGAAARNTIP